MLSRKKKNKRGLSYLLASFDFESGHDQMLPQPPLCTSTVYFCFPSSPSSSSSSSSSSSFFLPAPQRPNTYFRGQTRRKEEIDVSAREAQQKKERTRKKERRILLHRQRTKNPPRRRLRPRSSTGAGHPLTVHRFVVVIFLRSKTHLRIKTHSFECRRRERSSFLHSKICRKK